MLKNYFQSEKKMVLTGYILTFLLLVCGIFMTYLQFNGLATQMQWFFTLSVAIGLILSVIVFIHGDFTNDGDAVMIAIRSLVWFGIVLFIQFFSGFPARDNMTLYNIVEMFTWLLLIDVLVIRYELINKAWYVILMLVLFIAIFVSSFYFPRLGIGNMIISILQAVGLVIAVINFVKGIYRYYSGVVAILAVINILLFNVIFEFSIIDIFSLATIGEIILNGFLLIGAIKLTNFQSNEQ